MSSLLQAAAMPRQFDSREAMERYVTETFDVADTAPSSPVFRGTRAEALARLHRIKPVAYGKTRNYYDGEITRLSPYIRHGLLTLAEVRDHALQQVDELKKIEKFLQELTWREFWQRLYEAHPDWIWESVEPYKTGFSESDYADELPEDIRNGTTGVACIDHFIGDLLRDGYMHNHTRMYVASYVVHFRRVKWQAGAAWFLEHLLDGDPASNNLSWQWVASTFSNKPYIFNLENVAKYCGNQVECSAESNQPLDATYETLSVRLFPHKGKGDD